MSVSQEFGRTVVSLDLETTGLSTSKDRIVEVALVKHTPLLTPIKANDANDANDTGGKGVVGKEFGGTRDVFARLVNPTVPIPDRARAIHGITDLMVSTERTFAQIAPELIDFIEGVPSGSTFCGHNILRFDIPMLQSELVRAGFKPIDLKRFHIVDSLVLFRKLEPHTLTKAVEFYCPEAKFNAAHRATADAQAALDVWLSQQKRYQPTLGTDPKHIAAFCASNGTIKPPSQKEEEKIVLIPKKSIERKNSNSNTVAKKGGLVLTELDEAGKLTFGKHKGKLLKDVCQTDRPYLRWLARAPAHSQPFAKALEEALK